MIQNKEIEEIEEKNKQKQKDFIPFLEKPVTIENIKKIVYFLEKLDGYKGNGMEDALKFFGKINF